MSAEYAPGTVAVATVRGVEGVRVFRSGGQHSTPFWWTPEFVGDANGSEPQWRTHEDRLVTDVRPLVVLDLADGEAKELADYLSGVDMHLSIGDRLQIARQIRRQTKPPRIAEPTEPLAEVMAHAGRPNCRRRFVRGYGDRWVDGVASYGWDELIDPTLIREWVES